MTPTNWLYSEKKDFDDKKIEEKGKNVVINWDFLDGFNTDNNLWIDSNGLDMHNKRLWERKEYKYKLDKGEDRNIATNFYPVQSAIAIRDKNSDKQVTILTNHVMSGSAGLRN